MHTYQRIDTLADRWLIVDSRPSWFPDRGGVDESDARAFLELRREVATIGITPVDVMILDDELHWSLHELTSGTTRWPEPGTLPAVVRVVGA